MELSLYGMQRTPSLSKAQKLCKKGHTTQKIIVPAGI